jgi:hypothetical protein
MAYRSLARGQEHVKACSGLHTEGGPSGKGVFETRVALREAFFGNTSEAKRSAMKPLRLPGTGRCSLARPLHPPSRGILPGHKRSRMIWKRTIYPEDTAVRFNYMPSVRALLAQNHSERAKATELLQTAVSNELGQPRSAVNGFFGALYPIYVRGQAYLALHQRSPGSR